MCMCIESAEHPHVYQAGHQMHTTHIHRISRTPHALSHAHMHTCTHAHMHTCTCTHTHMHTYTHAHIHVTHISSRSSTSPPQHNPPSSTTTTHSTLSYTHTHTCMSHMSWDIHWANTWRCVWRVSCRGRMRCVWCVYVERRCNMLSISKMWPWWQSCPWIMRYGTHDTGMRDSMLDMCETGYECMRVCVHVTRNRRGVHMRDDAT